jgi:predicted DNA-binding protein (UPF0251 family)
MRTRELNLGDAPFAAVLRLDLLLAFALSAFVLLLTLAGCQKMRFIDTKALDQAGMGFSSVEAVKAMNPTDAEIAEVAKAKMGGLSDKTCIELLKISRSQGQPANFADAADGLVQAGMTESEIIELAKMKQLNLGYGELQAMRLTGLSDIVVMEVARRHAAGKQALSGVSLARLKDTGLSQAALFELVHRGIRDDQVAGIVALRRQRANEEEIMKRYPPVDVTPPTASTSSSPISPR